jgi:RimJ/RimL family protein N-acetyltransferase
VITFTGRMPFAPAEVLEIPRGVLSRISAADAEATARAVRASLDHLRPWLPWATPQAAEAQAQRQHCIEAGEQWDSGSDYVYVLRPDSSDEVIGCFGLHRRIGPGAIEIGYWVHAGFTGRGYATASARALTLAGLALPDVERVEIHTDEANKISAAIPQRLGYRLDRIDERVPAAPSETSRLQIWITDQAPEA